MKLRGNVSASETLNGNLQRNNAIIGNVNNLISGFDKCVSEVKIENKILYLTFIDGTVYTIDLSSYSGDDTTGLTEKQIEAINNMVAILNEDLSIEYDDEILNVDFTIEEGNLIVTNNVTGLDFSINENGEMEAIY